MGMSLSKALSVVEKQNKSAAAQISQLQGYLVKKNLRTGAPGDDGAAKAAAAKAAGGYSDSAWNALQMLNDMILEATQKMDFEVVKCDGQERTNLEQLKSIREDIIMFNAMAAQASASMAKA